MIRTALLAAAALSVAAPAAAATNLLTNGSFENGTAGWTFGGTTDFPPSVISYGSTAGYPGGAFGEAVPAPTVMSPSPDAVGTKGLYFVSDIASPQTISQTVNITTAGVYNFGFDVYVPFNGQRNPNDASLQVSVNGLSTPLLTASTTQAGNWNHIQSSGQLRLGTGAFTFTFRSNGTTAKDFVVDRAYLTAAVPEPATWAMMIAGFGMVGAGMRRRSAKGTLVSA